MRDNYQFPRRPFAQIGYKCLAWCLSEAWRRARQSAKIAALTVSELVERIQSLKSDRNALDYCDDYRLRARRLADLKERQFQLSQAAALAGLKISI